MKEKIALLTDSACDLSQEIIREFNIRVLPLKVVYGAEEYSDRVDIQPEDVYSQMPDKIPTTAMPGLGEIKQMFENIKAEGFTNVLAMHLSSGLSGTFDAVKMMARETKNLKIEMYDSKVLGIALGMQVWEAAKDISEGVAFSQVVENVKQRQPRIGIYYVIKTLEYLKKGGRIGRVEAVLGDLLNIKPIISCDDEGKYFTAFKARGRANSINKLAEIIENVAAKDPVRVAVCHGGAYEEAMQMKERLEKLPSVKEMIFGDISPALGVHTGPGLIGACFLKV
ncbi:MAG: DegV family protein [Syntrophomonadaceae bacterium]|nr:DegV family protein [Syntrophomonadaceae bacterium]